MTADLETKLCKALRDHPYKFSNRYDEKARTALLEILFRSLTNDRSDYFSALFPAGFPKSGKLTDAQGATERTEYTEAARGHPCGHIFKQGEASYHCMTCTDDATCVLCSRCFDSSDHEGHQFHISASAGNSGCCDCGDLEAWKRPVNCAIHTASEKTRTEDQPSPLPLDLINSIRTTIGRVLDYFCDVISCSPEQLRLPKTEESIKRDESFSRLGPKWYGGGDEYEANPEYCLIVWNDEKHTIVEVSDVIKRACRQKTEFGSKKAWEADDIGRSILRHSSDLPELIRMSNIVESIKVTTTIRTSRDTFREQMCGTIVEWLADIAGCSVGDDHHILRYTICEEMLQLWRVGSEAYNAQIGRHGIDDHEHTENRHRRTAIPALLELEIAPEETEDDEDDEIVEPDAEEENDQMEVDDAPTGQARNRARRREREWAMMQMELVRTHERFLREPRAMTFAQVGNREMDEDSDEEAAQSQQQEAGVFTPVESEPGDSGLMSEDQNRNYRNVPQTPFGRRKRLRGAQPSHWTVQPSSSVNRSNLPPHEDLSKNIRLDSMILFDMRMWKKTRIALRDLYISTVVNVPAFKRILGLRFSGLYTSLSQLYLIADREPDHSIINLSLQMLTSPSITEEVIERGNFLTNLMAILYTFLTSRQVGFPQDVSSSATLAFDTGSVTNRRLYHFFTDLRYFLSSEPVQRKVREEKQYLLQFIDLVKLSQGICPNIRAVGEHVEYETDAWIGASLLTRDINKLCRQFSESFSAANAKGKGSDNIADVIYTTAFATIVNSVGLERKRFDQTEIKEVIEFKIMPPFEFETSHYSERKAHRIVNYIVQKGALSFHHALHYTLSWLIEGGKSMSNVEMRRILSRAGSNFIKQYGTLKPTYHGIHEPEDAMLAMFDFPLRVCSWLAQMKAGLWVRNGMSLRHQMSQYKGVSFRDVGYHRDIFLLQTAIVTCDPARVLATMIYRYGLEDWMRGDYEMLARGWENLQLVDTLEDFIYLLIIILTDRASLITTEDEPNPLLVATRKDIIHALCFKPLSFSDLNTKLNEKVQDYQDLQNVLDEMTTFRAPEGLTDSGTFELKPEYLAELDPYNTNYNKNQRDEAENIYRRWMSKKTGKPAEEIVLEPNLRPIRSGVYTRLAAFTSTPLFAQVIYYSLKYVLTAKVVTPDVPATRLESLLHVILQLALIATLEDDTTEEEFTEESMKSFIRHALTSESSEDSGPTTIVEVLQFISNMDESASCRPKIKHMLKLFYRKRVHDFNQATTHLDFPFGRLDSASPANVDQGLEAKKRQALERKAKVMAQFQQQQKNFMDNQGVSDWYDQDLSDTETEPPHPPEKKMWKYPTGVCILCQEETNDIRLYGTFAMFTESNVLRVTNAWDGDWVREVLSTPSSLDRSIDHIRPFGVSGENHEQVVKLTADGKQVISNRQGLGKGWPTGWVRRSPISTGCGHLMHFACFDHYFRSIVRRHAQQIARHHPERTKNNEFVCPLCKALGNTFLPVLWKEKQESYPGVLGNEQSLESFLDSEAYRILPQQLSFEQGDFEAALISHASSSAGVNTGLAEILKRAASLGRPMTPTDPGASSLTELSHVFSRFGDTIKLNRLNLRQITPSTAEHVPHFEVLSAIIGSTVSAVEIAQRGVPVEPGNTLLEKTSAQTISHLRILSEMFNSYICMGEMTFEIFTHDFAWAQRRLFRQLFARSKLGLINHNGRTLKIEEGEDPAALLRNDIFDVFVQSCFILGPTLKLNIHHILHLCYMAHIVQIILAYSYNTSGLMQARYYAESHGPLKSPSLRPGNSPEVHALTAFLEWMMENINNTGYMPSKAIQGGEPALLGLIRSYSLTFLRKATILLHVSYGVDFPSSPDSESPELERLSHLLKLPSLYEILSCFQPYSGKSSIKDQVAGWILALAKHQQGRLIDEGADIPRLPSPGYGSPEVGKLLIDLARGIYLPHPAPLELIGLPKHFDVLMEEANHRKCPTTGKDLTDPALCLFCGEIFCSQAVCCMKNKMGPANLHVEKCSTPIGLFLSIRKCTILLLHIVPKTPTTTANTTTTTNTNPIITTTTSSSSSSSSGGGPPRSNGSWFHAPYLTRHGEVDPGLRQRHQLVLNQKRYDRLLRDVWLMVNNANVWSTVARKLEGEINGGGWESL